MPKTLTQPVPEHRVRKPRLAVPVVPGRPLEHQPVTNQHGGQVAVGMGSGVLLYDLFKALDQLVEPDNFVSEMAILNQAESPGADQIRIAGSRKAHCSP
jgi:hypothetical protein